MASRAERLKETGFFFGVPSLDRNLGAIRPCDYVVVSAETSGGKSLLAFQGALHAASKGMATAAFSFEMSFEQLWDRMFSHLARVSMNSFRGGLFTEEEYKRLRQNVPRFIDLPLHVRTRATTTSRRLLPGSAGLKPSMASRLWSSIICSASGQARCEKMGRVTWRSAKCPTGSRARRWSWRL